MKLWCLFLVFLMFTISTSYGYLNEHIDPIISYPNVKILQSSYFMQHDRYRRSTIVKRSQRNANILYRYCRRNGQAPNFCLKYAVRMIFATGH
ncbi:unnamed protein product [Rotaria magnacalcarata]|uniref:Uncharacterized protein n=1 Tax=Rotaria magnacalcarata TaxID=392030 RepID=A0A816CWY2_9BILA|nr:unnamed protein product [Rotaria magnacalcarata]CAF2049442.1 unnamed protein product [Rotaria magnacalcarata]